MFWSFISFLLVGFSILSAKETISGFERINGTFHIESAEDIELFEAFPTLIRFFDDIGFEAALNPAQRKEYEQKINFHKAEGQRCFNEANKICLLIPDVLIERLPRIYSLLQ